MNKSMIALVFLLVTGFVGSVSANDIYRWTDEDGNTQYGDHPPRDAERVMGIESRATNKGHKPANAQPQTDRRKSLAGIGISESEQPDAEELRAAARERANQCDLYRTSLQQLVAARPMYHIENGERVYLTEEEMLAARQEMEDKVETNCSR